MATRASDSAFDGGHVGSCLASVQSADRAGFALVHALDAVVIGLPPHDSAAIDRQGRVVFVAVKELLARHLFTQEIEHFVIPELIFVDGSIF